MSPFDPRLVRALPQVRRPVAVLSGLGVVGGLLGVAQAILLAQTVVRVVDDGAWWMSLTWLIAALVVRGSLAGIGERVALWAGRAVVGAVREAVLRSWLTRPAEARPSDEESVVLATEGAETLEPYVARYLPALVAAVTVPVASVIALLAVDVWSAAIVVVTLPLLPLFAALIGMHTREQVEHRWGAAESLSGHFLDVVRGLPTLVAYGRAERQVEVVAQVGQRHREATVRTLRTAFLSTAALELLATISVALVAVAVGLRLAAGDMGLAAGLTAILLAPEAYWPIRRVGAAFHDAADGAVALSRLAAYLDVPEGSSVVRERPSLIGVSDLTFAHEGRAATLDWLSLTTPAGPGLTVLTGPSGSGKTTLLELLAALRTPTAGAVSCPPTRLARQRPFLLSGSVRENLLLAAPGADDVDCRGALERVGLWPVLAGREGLDTRLGDDGVGLSAGQRARLSLARTLLDHGDAILLDEPTARVDEATVGSLRRVIVELAGTRRVIVATHDTALAALADDRWTLKLPDVPSTSSARVAEAANAPAPGGKMPHRIGESPVRRRRFPPRAGKFAGSTYAAAGLGGLATASGVALTATSGWLVVQASTRPVVLTLMVAIVGVRAFGIARPVLRYAERLVSHNVVLDDLATRRTDVYRRLIPLTPARLGRRSRTDLLTGVVRDLDDVVTARARATVPLAGTVLASVVAAVILSLWSAAAALVVIGATVAVLLLGRLAQRAEEAAQADLVTARADVLARTADLAGQLLAVQAVAGHNAPTLLARISDAEDRVRRAASRLGRSRGRALTGSWFVLAAAVLGVTWVAVSSAEASRPLLALIALTPMALADSWTGLPDIFGASGRARAAAARLAAVLDQEPAVRPDNPGRADTPDRLDQESPELCLDGVTARWARAHEGAAKDDLRRTDLTLAPGTRLLVTGPNGSGKSTLAAVLARSLDPTAGRYTSDGVDTRDRTLQQTRASIAVVDDEPHVFAGSVRANLFLAQEGASDAELRAALAAADLGDWLERLPDGLDTEIVAVSGGERTRLAMARAVLSRRPVLLLDEPTAHLDEAGAERVVAEICGALQRHTVVFITHRPPEDDGRWDRLELGTRPRAATAA